ncbi:MAG: YdeI/OmpD-associated family protein [Bacteroidota bacterium]
MQDTHSFVAPVLVHETGFRQHYLPLPVDVDAAFRADKVRRVVATLNGLTVRRGIQNRKASGRHLALSRDLMRQLEVAYGDLVEVEMQADPNPDHVDLGELAAALEADPEAKARFDTFTPGRQRGLAHYVTSAKRPETREGRAAELTRKIRTHTLHADRQRNPPDGFA